MTAAKEAAPVPRPLVCSVCGHSVAQAGVADGGRFYCPPCYDAPRQLALL